MANAVANCANLSQYGLCKIKYLYMAYQLHYGLGMKLDNDTLTRWVSAFNSWDELIFSMDNHGYVPTLRQTSAARVLGKRLEASGRKVYWSTCGRLALKPAFENKALARY
jgi:hypothetical protein